MNALNKSEKILISVLLIMLVSYAYYQYVITPVSTKLKYAQSNVDNYKIQLLDPKLMAASNDKMVDELNSLKADYDNYIKLMPKSNMSAEIIRDVNSIAVTNKVTLNSLTLGNDVEYKSNSDAANLGSSPNNNTSDSTAQNSKIKSSTTKIMAVPVAINITGDYNSCTAFVKDMETNSRIINIDSMDVTNKETDSTSDKLTVTINASMLYVQDGTTVQNNYNFNNGNYSKSNPFK